jgi:lysophospholipase L1-like esterase
MRVLLHFAGGDAFFTGCVLLAIGAILRMMPTRRWATLSARCVVFAGVWFVALSSTPWYWRVYVAWAIALAWMMLDPHRRGKASAWRTVGVPLAVLAISIYGITRELRYRRPPEHPGMTPQTVVVIGDSISAQRDNAITPWPKLIQEQHGVRVINLSTSGATLTDGLNAARDIPFRQLSPCVVVLAIGRNDVRQRRGGERFQEEFAQLLHTVSRPKNDVYFLELPLLPFQNHYGMAQRELGKFFKAERIPKNYFAQVLSYAENGLHLSQKGQEAMAKMIWGHISPKQ